MEELEKHVLYYNTDSGDDLMFKMNNKEAAFEVFCELYDTHYGSLSVEDNLISFSTGGWSDNEYLIRLLKDTAWWMGVHVVSKSGGHYYIDTDRYNGDKKHWKVIKE